MEKCDGFSKSIQVIGMKSIGIVKRERGGVGGGEDHNFKRCFYKRGKKSDVSGGLCGVRGHLRFCFFFGLVLSHSF